LAGTATVTGKRTLHSSRIIERPRLYALLDASTARIRMLVAGAGYGKSTLAEQWGSRDGRRYAWYAARSSSVDVAGLALGIARAAAEIVEGSEVRLREHLRAVPTAGERISVLAEIVSEDLASWPEDAWLVFDDYQEIYDAAGAEQFVAELVAGCPIQLLVTSRQRPTWVTAKRVLYGDVLEIGQSALAMTSEEAAEVLAEWTPLAASGLVALANGWPAVIGLAGAVSGEFDPHDTLPESLYEYLADEVFDALGAEVREGLALLAVAPVLDRELVTTLLGSERAERVCADAVQAAIVAERDDGIALHPLARSFLEEHEGFSPPPAAIEQCLDHYRARRDWDAAFDLIVRRDLTLRLEDVLADALDDLLETARVSTIDAWCDHAVAKCRDDAIFQLARAETALRQGRHAAAQTYAEFAAGKAELEPRALLVAGRAAHLASREERALELFERAELAAATDSERREALFGQVICLAELESPAAAQALEALCVSPGAADPRDVVRTATGSLIYGQRLGAIDIDDADGVSELLSSLSDPLVKSSFLSAYSTSLALNARYEDGLRAADQLHEMATHFRLDFAVPYALCWSAMALTGLRQWSEAQARLRSAIQAGWKNRDAHLVASCRAVEMRALAQQGRLEEALMVQTPIDQKLLPAVRAELLSSRALALAASGRIDDASDVLREVRGTSNAVEAQVLTAVVDGLISVKGKEPHAAQVIVNAQEVASSTGAFDLLVCAYRTAPELLSVLLNIAASRDSLLTLIQRVGDHDLLDAAGHPLSSYVDARESLSAREREVYDLLCQGLTNRQIADALVIEVSTVKAHAHHIYDKLGIRSRRQLAVRAALERQATSATMSDSGGS
jgi:LuxR family transcriptional regulator, maltose regulon positive regulatory protein